MALTNLTKIDPIKIDTMLTNECERDIQLELNRNYLKSFPARLKFCHTVSIEHASSVRKCIQVHKSN